MKTRVELGEQVVRFIAKQAPEQRRALRTALRGLESEQGDIKPLEGALESYVRLRVRSFRVIFTYSESKRGERLIRCVFAERRGAVYALFQETLRAQLLARQEGSIGT